MTWRKYLLIPQLSLYALAAPRDQARAWERYWSGVRSTGAAGEVLWDADQLVEAETAASQLRVHADLTLPMVDLGCGNGRQSRALTLLSPRVLGIDASAAAIARARLEAVDSPEHYVERARLQAADSPEGYDEPARLEAADSPEDYDEPARLESAGYDERHLEFRVADGAEPGLGERLAAELGEVNVHIRGLLHVLDPAGRASAVRNLAALLGRRGTAYVCETDVAGDQLEYLVFQGATPTRIPDVVRRCIAAGVRAPSHFGSAQVAECFPESGWRLLASGPTVMYGVPLRPGGPLQQIPSFFAVLKNGG